MCPRKDICEFRLTQCSYGERPVVSIWFGSRLKTIVFLTESLRRRKSFLRKAEMRQGEAGICIVGNGIQTFQRGKQTEAEVIAQRWGTKVIRTLLSYDIKG